MEPDAFKRLRDNVFVKVIRKKKNHNSWWNLSNIKGLKKTTRSIQVTAVTIPIIATNELPLDCISVYRGAPKASDTSYIESLESFVKHITTAFCGKVICFLTLTFQIAITWSTFTLPRGKNVVLFRKLKRSGTKGALHNRFWRDYVIGTLRNWYMNRHKAQRCLENMENTCYFQHHMMLPRVWGS